VRRQERSESERFIVPRMKTTNKQVLKPQTRHFVVVSVSNVR
jgi:hypothetical protein